MANTEPSPFPTPWLGHLPDVRHPLPHAWDTEYGGATGLHPGTTQLPGWGEGGKQERDLEYL